MYIHGGFSHPISSKHMEHYCMKKIILSHEPTTKDCVIMALCGELGLLAFCWPDKIVYDPSEFGHLGSGYIGFIDIVYWKNQFYAVDSWGNLTICELGVPSSPKVAWFLQNQYRFARCLVVNSFGELMMVNRKVKYPYVDDEDGEDGNEEEEEDDNEEEEEEDVNDDDLDRDNNDEWSYFYKTYSFEVFKLNEDKKQIAKGENHR